MGSTVPLRPWGTFLKCLGPWGFPLGRWHRGQARDTPTVVFSCTSETSTEPRRSFLPWCGCFVHPDPCSAVLPEGRTRSEAASPPVRFCTPLATSPAESGRPGITTPGTFRTWAFSTLLRFSPLHGSPALFHAGAASGVQRTGREPPTFPHGRNTLPEGNSYGRLVGRCNHRSDCSAHRARRLADDSAPIVTQ